MKLFVNDVALHDLGKLTIAEARTRPDEGQEMAPQRYVKTLRVKVWFTDPASSWEDRWALYREVDRAVAKQEPPLLWQDQNDSTLLDQTVTLTGHDWPSDPNEKMSRRIQQVELSFRYYETLDSTKTQAQGAHYRRTSSSLSLPGISLGMIEKVKESLVAERYSQLHPHRESQFTRLEMSGKLAGNELQTVAERRADLLARLAALKAEIKDGSSGTWTYQGEAKEVWVDAFSADLDQPNDHIIWNLTVRFTDFLDLSNYAQAQFEIVPREDKKTGKKTLLLAGEILANSRVAADAKLALLRAAHADGYSVISSEPRYAHVSGQDGDTFIKLTFAEELEPAENGVTESELRLSDSEDPASGIIRRTYSGFVEAVSALSWTAAYQTATTRARALGDNKHQVKLSAVLTGNDTPDRKTTGEFRARIEFAFEYRLKGAARVHVEMTSVLRRQTFGLDDEQVQGTIAAADASTARALYLQIKSAFTDGSAGTLRPTIREEQFSEQRVKVQKNVSAPNPASTLSPPEIGVTPPGVTVNTTEALDNVSEPVSASDTITAPALLGANYVRQLGQFNFSFSVHRAKPAGATAISVAYDIETAKNWQRGELIRTLDGALWAASRTDAEAFLTPFLEALNLGTTQVDLRQRERYERWPGFGPSEAPESKATFLQFTFQAVYVSVLAGGAAIREAELSEEIQTSGDNIVIQPTAASTPVDQVCGQTGGSRTIQGSVLATSEAVAIAFVKKTHRLPLPASAASAGYVREFPPPTIVFEPEALPMVEPVWRDGDYGDGYGPLTQANVKLVRCRFRFSWQYRELTMDV